MLQLDRMQLLMTTWQGVLPRVCIHYIPVVQASTGICFVQPHAARALAYLSDALLEHSCSQLLHASRLSTYSRVDAATLLSRQLDFIARLFGDDQSDMMPQRSSTTQQLVRHWPRAQAILNILQSTSSATSPAMSANNPFLSGILPASDVERLIKTYFSDGEERSIALRGLRQAAIDSGMPVVN